MILKQLTEKDKKEIQDIGKMLEGVSPEKRSVIKGFLLGAKYTEEALGEKAG